MSAAIDVFNALDGLTPKRRVLEALIQEELTKAALSVRTGLARSTVDRTVQTLEVEGWIASRKVGGICLYRPDERHAKMSVYLKLREQTSSSL